MITLATRPKPSALRWKIYFIAVLTGMIVGTLPAFAGAVHRGFLRCTMFFTTCVDFATFGKIPLVEHVQDKLEEKYLMDLYEDEYAQRGR